MSFWDKGKFFTEFLLKILFLNPAPCTDKIDFERISLAIRRVATRNTQLAEPE
jgi:hypothetical protein